MGISPVMACTHPAVSLVLPSVWVSKNQHTKHGEFLEVHIGWCFTADPTGLLFLCI
jgi:hypothetical protein